MKEKETANTVACLLVGVGFVSGLAETTAALQVPIAVAFAQVFGRRILDGVGYADAVRLLDGGQLAAGRRGGEGGERGRHLRTGDVVDADGQQRDAGALVAESEIDAFLRHRNRADLRVDDNLVCVEKGEKKFSRLLFALVRLLVTHTHGSIINVAGDIDKRKRVFFLSVDRPQRTSLDEVNRPSSAAMRSMSL